MTNVRKHARVHLTYQNECETEYADRPNIFQQSQTFCVVENENGSPCLPDECLFVKYYEKWYLRALLLTTYIDSNGNCVSGFPYLYEDIQQNFEWIQFKVLN